MYHIRTEENRVQLYDSQVGNESRLTVYGQEVDELVIINHTGELLVINNKTEILPGESSIFYKK